MTELVLATSVMDQFTDIPKHLVAQWILFWSQLLKGWGLPMSLCEPVFFHHRPEQAKDFPLITQIVHVADSIVDELKLGTSGEAAANPVKSEYLQKLGFNELPVEKFEQDIRDQYCDILVVLA